MKIFLTLQKQQNKDRKNVIFQVEFLILEVALESINKNNTNTIQETNNKTHDQTNTRNKPSFSTIIPNQTPK